MSNTEYSDEVLEVASEAGTIEDAIAKGKKLLEAAKG